MNIIDHIRKRYLGKKLGYNKSYVFVSKIYTTDLNTHIILEIERVKGRIKKISQTIWLSMVLTLEEEITNEILTYYKGLNIRFGFVIQFSINDPK
jgi:hypothetical protein